MATEPAGPMRPPVDMAALLCQLAETYGRGIAREPQRVAAMLRDLCPDRRRESFLLVSALRERVVADLMGSLDSAPDEILIGRCARKLKENLGLAEDSARWAVESWFPACRVLATAPDLPLRFNGEGEGSAGPGWYADAVPARARRVDWAWLALCVSAVLCSGIAVATVWRTAFYHYWDSLGEWSVETAILAAGLGAAGGGLAGIARQIRGRPAPNQRALDPNRAAFAMLVEVITLLVLPLVPVVAPALWIAEWAGELHIVGQAHDLSFQLGRILQTLVLASFLYFWVRQMTVIQGRIASSMVRRR